MINWEQRPSPNHWAGKRATTKGAIIHSTRGGAASQEAEYEATWRWFANPHSQVSAHRVIGFDGNGAICVEDDLMAWHAGAHNPQWLGVELTQPRDSDPFSDAQYGTLSILLRLWSLQYGFPLNREHLLAHSEINSHKSDPGDLFDWDKLLALLGDGDSMDKTAIQNVRDTLNGYVAEMEKVPLVFTEAMLKQLRDCVMSLDSELAK